MLISYESFPHFAKIYCDVKKKKKIKKRLSAVKYLNIPVTNEFIAYLDEIFILMQKTRKDGLVCFAGEGDRAPCVGA